MKPQEAIKNLFVTPQNGVNDGEMKGFVFLYCTEKSCKKMKNENY